MKQFKSTNRAIKRGKLKFQNIINAATGDIIKTVLMRRCKNSNPFSKQGKWIRYA